VNRVIAAQPMPLGKLSRFTCERLVDPDQQQLAL